MKNTFVAHSGLVHHLNLPLACIWKHLCPLNWWTGTKRTFITHATHFLVNCTLMSFPGKHLVQPHISHEHTQKNTFSLCWGLSGVCSLGLEGPAALSMMCLNVCADVWVLLVQLFLSLFLYDQQRVHDTFSISLCLHSIALYKESIYALTVSKVCLSTLYITWHLHLQSGFSQGFFVEVLIVHGACRRDCSSHWYFLFSSIFQTQEKAVSPRKSWSQKRLSSISAVPLAISNDRRD